MFSCHHRFIHNGNRLIEYIQLSTSICPFSFDPVQRNLSKSIPYFDTIEGQIVEKE